MEPGPGHDVRAPAFVSAGVLRLVWMVLPPILGTRRLATLTTLLLIPLAGWAIAVQNPQTSYTWLLVLSFLSGIGGGAFSGFMPSTSYFFPRGMQGTALGLQAGIGNFGVSLVQFVTPWIVEAAAGADGHRRVTRPARPRSSVPGPLCRQSATGQFSSVRSSAGSMSGVGSVR